MSRTRQRPTLRELGDHAGVSTATVSRVINNHESVAAETRRLVLDSMRVLGYGLAPKDLIGLIIPDSSNPYFADLGFVFQEQLDKLGAHLVIANSEGRADRELALVNQFKGLGLQGIIFISGGHPTETILTALIDENVPVVIFDRRVQAGNFDFVAVNNRVGMEAAVDYLITLGHTRIGHQKGLEGTRTARERYYAFNDALAKNRLEPNELWIWPGDYTFAAGRACAEELLHLTSEELPTALVVANDAMALGAMQRLQQAGWCIPRDMSIIGFDNIAACEWVHPRLTTVDQPVRHLAYEAISVLRERIRHHEMHPHDPIEPRLRSIDPMLIPRESTAPPRRQDPPPADGARIVQLLRPSTDEQ